MRLIPLACTLAALAPAARAHDTWFAPRTPAQPTEVVLALGTGDRFPVHESAIGFKNLARSGCRSDAPGEPIALQRAGSTSNALWLRAQARNDRPLSCWAQLSPFDVRLAPGKVAPYLKEIQAPASVRQQWAAMSARGVTWQERFTKHARIELKPVAGTTQPVDMAMDVLLESREQPPQQGREVQLRVLRDGQPLPDFAVELRNERSALGLWRRTDSGGRVGFTAPLPGRWLLRGTDLRLSEAEPDLWESRFVTLAFEVAPATP